MTNVLSVFSILFLSSRMAFPELGNQGGWVTKSTPVKGMVGGSLSRQKSAGLRSVERPLSSSPVSARASLKGKKEAMNKHSGKPYNHRNMHMHGSCSTFCYSNDILAY